MLRKAELARSAGWRRRRRALALTSRRRLVAGVHAPGTPSAVAVTVTGTSGRLRRAVAHDVAARQHSRRSRCRTRWQLRRVSSTRTAPARPPPAPAARPALDERVLEPDGEDGHVGGGRRGLDGRGSRARRGAGPDPVGDHDDRAERDLRLGQLRQGRVGRGRDVGARRRSSGLLANTALIEPRSLVSGRIRRRRAVEGDQPELLLAPVRARRSSEPPPSRRVSGAPAMLGLWSTTTIDAEVARSRLSMRRQRDGPTGAPFSLTWSASAASPTVPTA